MSIGTHKYTATLIKECSFNIIENIKIRHIPPNDWP